MSDSNREYIIDKIRFMASEGKNAKEIAETLGLREAIVKAIVK